MTTLFVVNDQQLIRTYPGSVTTTTSGAYALARLNTRLSGLATAGYRSAILHVDNSAAVRTAYDAWNGCPADPAKANAVVAGITAQVKALRASNPTLAFVVLSAATTSSRSRGIADLTTISNENGYAETFPGATRARRCARPGADAERRRLRRRRAGAVPRPSALRAGALRRAARREAVRHRRAARPVHRSADARPAASDDGADDRIRLPQRRRRAR